MKKSVAERLVGGLGKTTKMPCKSFGLSPSKCKRGGELRKDAEMVCHGCYACSGQYHSGTVKEAHRRRYEKLDHPLWAGLMAEAIGNSPYFRWLDSGDIQSLKMLDSMIEVCRRTPNTLHWLPTREVEILKRYLAVGRRIPDNLTIRISLDKIDDNINQRPVEGLPIAVVSKAGRTEPEVFNCPSDQSGALSCDEHKCRKCWDRDREVINYVQH